MAKTARWRKEPSEGGLRSIGQGPRGYQLRLDGKVLISVNPAGGAAFNGPLRGWYWAGMGRNTYNEGSLFGAAEDARDDAHAFYRACLRATTSTRVAE